MAIIKKYKSIVTDIINPSKGIYTVSFKADKKYKYNPGQFLHLALDNYDGIGEWPESRCFSMQSSPEEEEIKITFSVKGKFTSRMENELCIGKEVWLKLPYGDLFDKEICKDNSVFIAGGTGITPFLSLFNHSFFYDYKNPKIYLGFKSDSFNIYSDELYNIKNDNVSIKYFYENHNGIIDINSIFAENGLNTYYFISGPPIMIKTFKHYLIANNVNISNIITDDWE